MASFATTCEASCVCTCFLFSVACEDHDDSCPDLAAEGQCYLADWGQMFAKCPKSCSQCGENEISNYLWNIAGITMFPFHGWPRLNLDAGRVRLKTEILLLQPEFY